MKIKHWLREQAGADGGNGDGGTPPATPPAIPPASPPAIPPASFLDSLGEDVRSNAALADFKDASGLAKSYVALKAYQGQSIRIPTGDAGAETKQEFYDKLANVEGVMLKPDMANTEQATQFYKSLGRPDEESGYEYAPAEDGYNGQEESVALFRKLAHANGITKAQFNNIMSTVVAQEAQQVAASKANTAAEVNGLKTKWGDAYDQNMLQATQVAAATGAPEKVIEAMKAGQTGQDFNVWMHSLASKFNGEGQNLMNIQEQNNAMTPDLIRGKIDDIMNNKQHPYWDGGHPDHGRALQDMLALQKKLSK